MTGYAWDDQEMRDDFRARVERHSAMLARRGLPVSAETIPPLGQAANWYWELVAVGLPRSARNVARQVARLCREEFAVTVPWRSLADAVGIADKGGRTMAYTQRGVAYLVESGWLEVATTGRGRGASTAFTIAAGQPGRWANVDLSNDLDDEWEDVA